MSPYGYSHCHTHYSSRRDFHDCRDVHRDHSCEKLGLGRLGDNLGMGLTTGETWCGTGLTTWDLGIGLGLVRRLGTYLVWDWSDYLGLTGLTAWDLLGVHNWCHHDVSLATFQF